ncbi:MAG TPA: flagellar protein FliS [Fibrobacteraceae bacterium]|nr:flagellar protein FliS [Fibrobacteraceae bacterium]
MNPAEAAQAYAYSAAMTASDLKSHQMLLERALLLLAHARNGDLQSRNRAQDIVSQLQNSLNLAHAPARKLFEVFGYIWDALEWKEASYLDRAEDMLRQMLDLVVRVQRQ